MKRFNSILPWLGAALVVQLLGACVETADYGTAENTATNTDPTSANDTVTNTNTGTGQETNTNTENAAVEGVVFLRSDPVNGATGVRIGTDLTITLQGVTNPDTVTGDRVTLKAGDSDLPVAVDASYDTTTGTLTIDPREPLSYATNYTLSLSGAKDALGNAVDDIATFRTYDNPITHITNYDAATGSISDYTVYEYTDHVLTRTVTYNDPGIDGDWSTVEDNVVANYHTYVPDSQGRPYRVIAYNPGPNGKWLDDDDTVVGYVQYNRDGHDVISGVLTFIDPGTVIKDNVEVVDVWFNGNDKVGPHVSFVNDNEGRQVKAVAYADAKNTIVWWEESKYQPDGARRLWHFDGNRPNIWGEIYNESVAFTELTVTNATTGAELTIRTPDWGSDTKWFTADDVMGSYVFTARVPGLLRSVKFIGAGADGVWLDDDDVVSQYTEIVSNADDNRISKTIYVSPGSDGYWLDGSDVAATVITYDPNR